MRRKTPPRSAAGFAAVLLGLAVATAGSATAAGSAAVEPGMTGTAVAAGLTAGSGCAAAPSHNPVLDGYDAEQLGNAEIIVRTGMTMGVPARGWVIAVATAMQESWLHNQYGDRDSVGLFQYRPSQGWGTADQLMDPAYSAGAFYRAMLRVPDWQTRPLTEVAQAVQISAFPNAYAKHETAAKLLVDAIVEVIVGSPGGGGEPPTDCPAGSWTQPVAQAVLVSGFRTPDRPVHNGVDLAAPRGTPVRAVSAGTVVRVRCNAIAPDGTDYGCDRDGSPSVRGCGWYIDILHADGIVTRYCNLLAEPRVSVGGTVVTGEVIGLVGMSGNAAMPATHFEVHTGLPASNANAVDPMIFMASVGAPLS